MKKNYLRTLGITGLVALTTICPMGLSSVNVLAAEAGTPGYAVEETIEENMVPEQDTEVSACEADADSIAEETLEDVTPADDDSDCTEEVAGFGQGCDTTDPGTENPEVRSMLVAGCKEFITLRPEADRSAKVMLKIPLGSEVIYIGDSDYNDEFAYVNYQDKCGYVLKKYLIENAGHFRRYPGTEGTNGQTVWAVRCEKFITLRPEPTRSAKVLLKIPRGSQLTLLCDANDEFAYVNYNGTCGYALKKFLTDDASNLRIYPGM